MTADRLNGEVIEIVTESPQETAALGEALGRVAEAGDVLLLHGPFGAGKTVLVQGLARGLGVSMPVVSSSFVLASEHRGRLLLVHADFFRLEQPEASLVDSLFEYLDDGAVIAVEWPERLPVPPWLTTSDIHLEPLGEQRRRIRFRPARRAQADAARRYLHDGASARRAGPPGQQG